jgi:hypothetical protein
LKRVWIDLKRKNVLGGVDAVSPTEELENNREIIDLLR